MQTSPSDYDQLPQFTDKLLPQSSVCEAHLKALDVCLDMSVSYFSFLKLHQGQKKQTQTEVELYLQDCAECGVFLETEDFIDSRSGQDSYLSCEECFSWFNT